MAEIKNITEAVREIKDEFDDKLTNSFKDLPGILARDEQFRAQRFGKMFEQHQKQLASQLNKSNIANMQYDSYIRSSIDGLAKQTQNMSSFQLRLQKGEIKRREEDLKDDEAAGRISKAQFEAYMSELDAIRSYQKEYGGFVKGATQGIANVLKDNIDFISLTTAFLGDSPIIGITTKLALESFKWLGNRKKQDAQQKLELKEQRDAIKNNNNEQLEVVEEQQKQQEENKLINNELRDILTQMNMNVASMAGALGASPLQARPMVSAAPVANANVPISKLDEALEGGVYDNPFEVTARSSEELVEIWDGSGGGLDLLRLISVGVQAIPKTFLQNFSDFFTNFAGLFPNRANRLRAQQNLEQQARRDQLQELDFELQVTATEGIEKIAKLMQMSYDLEQASLRQQMENALEASRAQGIAQRSLTRAAVAGSEDLGAALLALAIGTLTGTIQGIGTRFENLKQTIISIKDKFKLLLQPLDDFFIKIKKFLGLIPDTPKVPVPSGAPKFSAGQTTLLEAIKKADDAADAARAAARAAREAEIAKAAAAAEDEVKFLQRVVNRFKSVINVIRESAVVTSFRNAMIDLKLFLSEFKPISGTVKEIRSIFSLEPFKELKSAFAVFKSDSQFMKSLKELPLIGEMLKPIFGFFGQMSGASEFFKLFAKTFGKALMGIFNIVFGVIGIYETYDAFKQGQEEGGFWKGVYEGIKTAVEFFYLPIWIANTIGELIVDTFGSEDVKAFFEKHATDVRGKFSLLTLLGNGISMLADSLQELGDQFWIGIWLPLTLFKAKFITLGQTFRQAYDATIAMLAPFGRVVSDIFTSFGTRIATLMAPLISMFQPVINLITNVANMFNNIFKITSTFSAIGTFMKTIAGTVVKLLGPIAWFVSAFTLVQAFFDGYEQGGLKQAIMDTFEALIDKVIFGLPNFVLGLVTDYLIKPFLSDEGRNELDKMVKNEEGEFSIYKILSSVVTGLINSVTNAVDLAVERVKEWITAFTETKFYKTLETTFTDVINGITKTFSDLFEFKSISDTVDKIIKLLFSWPNLIIKGVANISAWFLRLLGFDEAAEDVQAVADTFDLVKMVQDTVKGVTEWFANLINLDKATINKVVDVLAWLPNLIKTGLTSVATWFLGDLMGWDDSAKQVQDISDSFDLKGMVKKGVEGIATWLGGLLTLDEKAIGTLIDIVAWLPNLVVKGMGNIAAWILELFGMDELAKNTKKVTDEVSIGQLLMSVFKNIKDWFTAKFDFSEGTEARKELDKMLNLITIVEKFMEDMGKFFSDLFDIDYKKIMKDTLPDSVYRFLIDDQQAEADAKKALEERIRQAEAAGGTPGVWLRSNSLEGMREELEEMNERERLRDQEQRLKQNYDRFMGSGLLKKTWYGLGDEEINKSLLSNLLSGKRKSDLDSLKLLVANPNLAYDTRQELFNALKGTDGTYATDTTFAMAQKYGEVVAAQRQASITTIVTDNSQQQITSVTRRNMGAPTPKGDEQGNATQ